MQNSQGNHVFILYGFVSLVNQIDSKMNRKKTCHSEALFAEESLPFCRLRGILHFIQVTIRGCDLPGETHLNLIHAQNDIILLYRST